MPNVTRFGVSIESQLLERFDGYIRDKDYPNRSEAIRDLIRDALVAEDWETEKMIAGGIALVYDHHHNQLVNHLIDIQHDFHEMVLASQHIHLDHDNCLEILVVRGVASEVHKLYDQLAAEKGIKHISVIRSTIGSELG
jgi:CopG family nickel-responsive transcriptional regulator